MKLHFNKKPINWSYSILEKTEDIKFLYYFLKKLAPRDGLYYLFKVDKKGKYLGKNQSSNPAPSKSLEMSSRYRHLIKEVCNQQEFLETKSLNFSFNQFLVYNIFKKLKY